MVIAEIGTSHEGSLDKARLLIDAAAAGGADAAKFQWVYADEILHPDTGFVDLPTGRIALYEKFRQLECPPDFFRGVLDYARSKGLRFVCSPFGEKSLAELLALRPDAVKIASPELNHFPMLRALALWRDEQKKRGEQMTQVIVSSGVSKLKDIEAALAVLGKEGVTLLHCVTSYPAPEDEYNLRLVKTLREIFGVQTGVSDHSLGAVLVPCLATAMGAVCVEKHITLSKETKGLDDPIALSPDEFSQMTMALKQCRAALEHYGAERGSEQIIAQMSEQFGAETVGRVLGDGIKRLAPSEEKNYGRTNRSLHYTRSLERGSVVDARAVGILRTEKQLSPGLPPEFLQTVIGRKLSRTVQSGAGVVWEDFLF